MEFKEALAVLLRSPTFHAWQKENPDHYLAHGFVMHDKTVKQEWQIGFYNRKEDRIVVFAVGEEVTQNPPSEVFKKDSGVKELDVSKVHHDAEAALVAAHEHRQEKYKGHEPVKTIVLLQHLKQGQVWNISFVTNTFSVCNIKLDASSLEVLSSSCESLLGWGQTVPGTRK
jgi:hypothetical protein